MTPAARCAGNEARASNWLLGLILTEGGTCEEQAAIVLRNDRGEEACLLSSELSAQELIPVNAAPGRLGYVSGSSLYAGRSLSRSRCWRRNQDGSSQMDALTHNTLLNKHANGLAAAWN